MCYICCKEGRTAAPRSEDGFRETPHRHYTRSVVNKLRLLHFPCYSNTIRAEIYDAVTLHVSPAWMKENNYLGVSQEKKELHNREICRCGRGIIYKEKSGDGPQRAFYTTVESKSVKEKAVIKRKLMEFITEW